MPLSAMLYATAVTKIWNKKWGYFSFYMGILSMTAGPIMFIPNIEVYLGLVQRFGIGMSLLLMVIVALKLLND
ncbi:MAG: hypothetical protein Q8P90_06225 [bacterium]|nr:hypothetical protein [bacterium]